MNTLLETTGIICFIIVLFGGSSCVWEDPERELIESGIIQNLVSKKKADQMASIMEKFSYPIPIDVPDLSRIEESKIQLLSPTEEGKKFQQKHIISKSFPFTIIKLFPAAKYVFTSKITQKRHMGVEIPDFITEKNGEEGEKKTQLQHSG